jgi:hypothetical protein
MPAGNKDLKLANGKIAPQFYDEVLDDYVIAHGENGAPYYRARGSIAMESWTEANPMTSFPSLRYGFSIVNDGTADLSFTINGYTRTVRPGEGYNALFEPFKSLTINATSAYRAEVLR